MRSIVVILLSFAVFLFVPQSALAQSCPAPAQTTGVLVEYPECTGDSCSFVQASCTWNAVVDATSFTYTITEVDTNTQIQTNSVAAGSALKAVFPVTQGRTYKCDVMAVNSCGSTGPAGTHQLLCEADALIDTPTPTTPAVVTPLPTKAPPIESPGAFETTAVILGGITLVIVGGLALLFL